MEHGALGDGAVCVRWVHDTRQGCDAEDMVSAFVGDVSGDHAAEGVPDDGEGLVAEVVVDLGEYLVGHVNRALRGCGRRGGLGPWQVEEHQPPRQILHRVRQWQHDAVVHPEAVESDERTTGTKNSRDHPASL
ncbi:hypothetical protein Cus16_2133 [Curtobacterium sp. ER1/6]|nr:hypothetical protein Cus16_2133 [Curtobacterium sp. ER1/6]